VVDASVDVVAMVITAEVVAPMVVVAVVVASVVVTLVVVADGEGSRVGISVGELV
jgi:hypothetical protein